MHQTATLSGPPQDLPAEVEEMEVEDANPPWNARERTLIAKMKRYLENSEKSKWESESWSISCSILKRKQAACFPQLRVRAGSQ